jgi:hypothetical protein
MWGEFMEEEQEAIIPNTYEQQIILTCKGLNKNKDTIEAIRNILAQQFGLETKFVYDSVIYRWLVKYVKKFCDYKHIDNFLENLFERKNEITVINAIKDLISILSSIDVIDKNGKELIHLEKNNNIMNYKE